MIWRGFSLEHTLSGLWRIEDISVAALREKHQKHLGFWDVGMFCTCLDVMPLRTSLPMYALSSKLVEELVFH